MRSTLRVALVAGITLSQLPSSLAQLKASGLAQLSAICGTESRPGWRQIFAFDGQWKKYRALSEVPESHVGITRMAQVWQGPMGMTLVTINPDIGEIFVQTSYCFQESGHLLALTHDVRHPAGWGFFELRQYDISGRTLSSSARFFDSTSGDELRHRKKDVENQALLKPTLYSRFEDLPFASLYRPLTEAEKY
jgi:hypothetical protein